MRRTPLAARIAAVSAVLCAFVPGAAGAGPAGASSPGSIAATAPRYGDDHPTPLAPAEASLAAAIFGEPSRGSARLSGALVRAARALARRAASGEADPLGGPAQREALARAAAFDPAPAALLARGSPDRLAAALAPAVRARATHYGVGLAGEGERTVAVVLTSARKVRLDPLPAMVAPGAAATVSGVLEPGLLRPRVFVASPTGDVVEPTLAAEGAGARFRASVTFAAPGHHVVEVVADGPGGPEVVALATVTAGDPPRAGPISTEVRLADPPGEAAAEAAVLSDLNALRGRHGLEPLRSSPALAAVARDHAVAMRDAGRIAHLLPGRGDLPTRVGRAGVAFHRAWENVARAAGARAAHEVAAGSPAHLANMLQPGAALAGIGVARGRLASGEPIAYLAEVLVEPPAGGLSSRLTPEGEVKEALWAGRARLGAPPLTADAALEALAREAAAALRDREAAGRGDPDDLRGAVQGLPARALALGRGRALSAADVFVATGAADATRSTNLRDARFRRVGVGVVPGESRRLGPRLFVAVVYTD